MGDLWKIPGHLAVISHRELMETPYTWNTTSQAEILSILIEALIYVSNRKHLRSRKKCLRLSIRRLGHFNADLINHTKCADLLRRANQRILRPLTSAHKHIHRLGFVNLADHSFEFLDVAHLGVGNRENHVPVAQTGTGS